MKKTQLVTSQELINNILEYMRDSRYHFHRLTSHYNSDTLVRFESNYYLVEMPEYYERATGEIVLMSEDEEILVYSIDENQAKSLFLKSYETIDGDSYYDEYSAMEWNIHWSISNELTLSNSLDNINKELITSQEFINNLIAYTKSDDFEHDYEYFTFIGGRIGFRLIEYKCNWYLLESKSYLIDTLLSKVEMINDEDDNKQVYSISENDAKSLYLDSYNEDDRELIINQWNDLNRLITSRELLNNLTTDIQGKLTDTLRTYINRDDYFIPYEIIRSFSSEIIKPIYSNILSDILEEYSNMIVDINEGLVTSQELIDNIIAYNNRRHSEYANISEYPNTIIKYTFNDDYELIDNGYILKYDSNYFLVQYTDSDDIFYQINEDIAKIIYNNIINFDRIRDIEEIIEQWNDWKIQ